MTEESKSVLFIHRLSGVEAENSFIKHVGENIENTIIHYLSTNALKDQKIILQHLDSKNIETIVVVNATEMMIFDMHFLLKIKSSFEVKLIGRFADSCEYFDTFFVYVAQFYDKLLVDDNSEIQRYQNYGFNAQWWSHGYEIKYKMDPTTKRDIDVAFVGRMDRSGRKELLSLLYETGLNIALYGYGTDNGFISNEEMMEMYGRSKIVLNLTSISTVIPHFESNKNINRLLRQAKGRISEAALAGAMVLTEPAALSNYGKSGETYVIFNSPGELVKTINYYIKNENERIKIATAGFGIALKNGTHESQSRHLALIIKETKISNVGEIYLDSIYHKFISRSLLDNYLRQLIVFKKPDFSVLHGKRIDFLIYAFFRVLFLYPFKMIYKKIK